MPLLIDGIDRVLWIILFQITMCVVNKVIRSGMIDSPQNRRKRNIQDAGTGTNVLGDSIVS